MLVGYARVSTFDQNLALQTDALKTAGCETIFDDTASGVADERKGLKAAMAFMREGDTLVVWKLDRLGRSLRHLLEIVNTLASKNIGFKSLQENLDTTTTGGRLVFHIFGALAEFEREVIVERTQAGLRAARSRGRCGGRPAKLDPKQVDIARYLMHDPQNSIDDVCEALHISRATLYRSVAKADRRESAALAAKQ